MTAPLPAPGPRFSIIVPSRGEASRLAALLAALEAQTLPRGAWELLLALDGAPLPAALEPRLAALGGRAIALPARRGPGAARNAAAAQARGEWLAFTEDDVTPAPDWLEQAAARIARAPAPDVIEGVTTLPGGAPLRTQLADGLQYLPTTLFVRRGAFERVGGYHEGFFDASRGVYFREDSDLGFTLEELGAAAVREPLVRVTHPREHTGPWEPLRWAARYEMDPLLERRHPRRFHDRIEVHRLGALRVRRPIVRLCMGFVLCVALAAGLVVAGRGPAASLAVLLGLVLFVPIWAKWRLSLLHLPAALLVPFVLTAALWRGRGRAAAWAASRRSGS